MNVALIDMGSNSIRLAVYKVEQKDFEPIFSKRYMTGLASYVKEKQLTAAGVEQACTVLMDAKSLLEQLSVDQTTVFATASLRNIKNTEAVVAAIQQKTGYTVQILSGHEEAFLDYFGVMHGLYRALIHNMVVGVTTGFTKNLELVGVGYRAQADNPSQLTINIGFSHPVVVKAPENVTFATPTPNKITVSGIDKQVVGEIAAEIRAIRKPEPYHGKGIRYENEVVRHKEGKAGKK